MAAQSTRRPPQYRSLPSTPGSAFRTPGRRFRSVAADMLCTSRSVSSAKPSTRSPTCACTGRNQHSSPRGSAATGTSRTRSLGPRRHLRRRSLPDPHRHRSTSHGRPTQRRYRRLTRDWRHQRRRRQPLLRPRQPATPHAPRIASPGLIAPVNHHTEQVALRVEEHHVVGAIGIVPLDTASAQ
jgi:hypothetical protein